jgi:phospholipid/cholesterol/gamma-HCH transport system ATP-binding protein
MIEFREVHKSFGSKHVLRGMDLKIEAGEIFFILGTSGTGKSVTLKLIVGLLRSDSGTITVDGEDVTEYSERDFFGVRKKAGMVFQFPALLDSITVFENVAFGLRRHTKHSEEEIHTRVMEVLTLVNLREVSQRLPQELSYGM